MGYFDMLGVARAGDFTGPFLRGGAELWYGIHKVAAEIGQRAVTWGDPQLTESLPPGATTVSLGFVTEPDV